jgi:hypothetical protein
VATNLNDITNRGVDLTLTKPKRFEKVEQWEAVA